MIPVHHNIISSEMLAEEQSARFIPHILKSSIRSKRNLGSSFGNTILHYWSIAWHIQNSVHTFLGNNEWNIITYLRPYKPAAFTLLLAACLISRCSCLSVFLVLISQQLLDDFFDPSKLFFQYMQNASTGQVISYISWFTSIAMLKDR